MNNVALIRSAYEAFARHDLPAVLAVLDPDIRWTEAEGYPYGGTYLGIDAVVSGVFARIASEWQSYRSEPAEFLDAGEQVVALGFYSGTYNATGKSMRVPFAHVWKIRDDKIVAYTQYTDTRKMAEVLS